MYGFGWLGMLVGGLLLLALVALLVWAATSAGGRSGSAPSALDKPIEILKRRYAAGEISSAEFEQARRAIE